MFIGREKELAILDNLYNSDKFEFAVIYGRRRVGKTALISHFIQDKKAIYFMGVESNEKQNLENFSQAVFECNTGGMIGSSFMSFQAALEYVFKISESERLVLVIDEYSYVAKSSKSLASTLQMLIDKNKDNSKLMLILCGSSMSYMEDNVLAYKAPLYGRRTAQMKILPFDFGDACKYFNRFSPEDMAMVYGLVGGTPQYLLQMDDHISIEDNIKNIFLNPSSSIFEEPENILKQEVREPAIYNAIITAVAAGSSRISEVATKIGETTSVCAQYIKNLIGLGIILKETPYGEKESRRSVYAIADNMFRFWYRFVPDNNSIISRGAADLAYKRIEPALSDYMGKIFEEISMQYLWKLLLNGESPIEFMDLGRWWGTDPREKIQTEIDIMGEQDKNTVLFGECKWVNENVDVKVLEKLKNRSRLFRYEHAHLYLFAKKGFTQGCIDEAEKMGNVSLVTYGEMYRYMTK
ncbi:MAG: ATP-binding protein [Agathobacter sp.]|uniref:ATP-binding protein n=1 Tax=Agathobacter sp. TaxID=2021311 RepID=UPI0039958C19